METQHPLGPKNVSSSNRLNASRSVSRLTFFVEVDHNQPKEEVVLTLVAYAKAGSMPIALPSGSLPREVRGSDTAQYAPVSLDIVLPTSVALDWVTRMDLVKQFSNSTLTLGAIQRVMDNQNQAWDAGYIIINKNYIKENSEGKVGGKHSLPTPPSPDSTMCGIKQKPLHGKPKDVAKTRPVGRKYCCNCTTEGECNKKPCEDLHFCSDLRLHSPAVQVRERKISPGLTRLSLGDISGSQGTQPAPVPRPHDVGNDLSVFEPDLGDEWKNWGMDAPRWDRTMPAVGVAPDTLGSPLQVKPHPRGRRLGGQAFAERFPF